VLVLYLQTRAPADEFPAGALALAGDRAEVHQATGVVSVQAGVSLAEAFVLLRARAYADQRPVADVARDVLAGRVDLAERPDER
jgi:hypothetical protein